MCESVPLPEFWKVIVFICACLTGFTFMVAIMIPPGLISSFLNKEKEYPEYKEPKG